MTAEECIHLIDPATCTICNGRDRAARRAERVRDISAPFPARYVSTCWGCRSPIAVDDQIVIEATDDGRHPYHHGCEP